MSQELKKLFARAKRVTMSSADREAQRQSFAYGNAKIENSRVTKAMVREAAAAKPKRA